MILVINAPPVSKIAGIAKEYRWIDRLLIKSRGRVNDHYLIEPKDWNDPTYFGINMIIKDFIAANDTPRGYYDRCINLGLTPIDTETMYAKLDRTYSMIFDAMENELHEYELNVLFPLPWACPPGQAGTFTTMHGVLHEQYQIVNQAPVVNKGEPIAIRYTVRRKDEQNVTNNTGDQLESSIQGEDPTTDNRGEIGDSPKEESPDIRD